jgi:hypothetical protein
MLIIPPPQFRKHRGKRIKAPKANHIVRVSHDTVGNRLDVIVNSTLSDAMDFAGAMQVSADGVTWVSSFGGNFNTPPQALISFPSSIVAKTQWRIVDPTVWVFEDGRALMPPYFGAIA